MYLLSLEPRLTISIIPHQPFTAGISCVAPLPYLQQPFIYILSHTRFLPANSDFFLLYVSYMAPTVGISPQLCTCLKQCHCSSHREVSLNLVAVQISVTHEAKAAVTSLGTTVPQQTIVKPSWLK